MRRFVFVCLLGAALCGPAACREKTEKTVSHSDIIGPPVLDKSADQLTQTEFTAYLNHSITPGKNLLWCATMPLAWNELLDLADGEIHIAEGDPPLVTELGKSTVTNKDLDDSSYVALAGLTPNILEVISRALATKFKGQASPELLGQIPKLPDNSAVAYSYLFKDLEFESPFKTFEEGMRFHEEPEGTTIQNKAVFGFRDLRTESTAKAADQVEIHDYRNRDDFVIEISTKSTGDRLLLAKIHSDSTLAQTIQSVQARADTSQGKPPESKTWMQVPILNFSLVKDYKELLSRHIRCSNETLNGQFFVMARQSIRFKLNEAGAKLKSETVVAATWGGIVQGHEPPQLIFDKPFLILMERKGAAHPYFALWIDNSELLVPFTSEKTEQ